MAIRLMIVDDHAMVRSGLRTFFGLDPEIEVVGETADGVRAVELARQLRPDVVLMDVALPRMDGVKATAIIRRELPDTQVIVISAMLDERVIMDALRAGATGYLLKDAEANELRRAIKAAAVGQVQLSPRAAEKLLGRMDFPRPEVRLTRRELEVLRLVASGQPNKEIAKNLNLSEPTVKTHVSSILSRLGLASRTQAALYASQIGLVAEPGAVGREAN